MHWLYLFTAILFETIGTTALQASQNFTRPGPTLLLGASYAVSFYMLTLVLRTMPVGVAYAIWSGLGVCFVAAISAMVFGQRLDWAAVVGMGFIVVGIGIINLFSGTATH